MPTETEARPIAVERLPYKQNYIEIEIYCTDDGRYKAWPYVGVASAHSNTKRHVILSGTFDTLKLAIEAAVKEGQNEIDIRL